MSQNYEMLNIDKDDFINLIKTIVIAISGIFIYIIVTGYILRELLDKVSNSIFYPISSTLTAFIFLVALYFRAREVNINGVKYLLAFAFSLVLFNFLQIFAWDIAVSESPFQRPLGYPILYISDLMIPLISLSLFFHLSSIEKERIKRGTMILVGLFIFPSIVLSILMIFTPNESINNALFSVLPFLAITVLSMTIYGLKVMIRIYFNNKDGPIRAGSLTMITSLLYMAIAFTTQILTEDTINFGLFKAEIFQLLLFAIASSLLGYTYIKNPMFLYAIPFDVYELMIYDINGKAIWHYNFLNQEEEDDEINLRSKGLSAIGAILKEISGFRGEIRSIELTDGNLIINAHTLFSVCLITEVKSPQLVGACNNFATEFSKIYNSTKEIDTERINCMIQSYFPYSK